MERPRIKIRLTALDYIVEVLSLLSVLAAIILYIIYWKIAPEVVPIHYNIYGEVDGYGSKTALLILPISSVLIYVGLTILNRYPHIFNFPTTVTEQNALSLYKIATRMVRWLKLLCCFPFVHIIWNEVRIIITHQEPKFGGIVILLLVPCIIFYLVFFITKMIKIGKKNNTIKE